MLGTEYSEYKLLYHRAALLQDRPPFAMWDLTMKCNHRCKWCVSYCKPLYNPSGDEWDFSLIEPVAEELRSRGVKAIHFTGGGEPLMYPHFAKCANLLLGMGFQLSLVTNGVLLSRIPIDILKRFTWIRVSIDAIKDETYQEVRGAESIKPLWSSLEKVLPALEKAPVTVGASFVVFAENVSEIHPFTVWAKVEGFDNCRISYGWSPKGMTIFEETKAKASEQLDWLDQDEVSDDSFQVFSMRHRLAGGPPRISKHCYYSDAVVIIGADSEVYRCCVLKYMEEGKLGSLKNQTFTDIWKNRGEQDVSQCPMCYSAGKNEFAAYLMCSDPKHINFI